MKGQVGKKKMSYTIAQGYQVQPLTSHILLGFFQLWINEMDIVFYY